MFRISFIFMIFTWNTSIFANEDKAKLIVVFGEMGSGKSFVAKRIAKAYGYYFYEGDNAIPPNMLEKVKNFEALTPQDIDDFVRHYLIKKVKELMSKHKHLVLAQALYMNKHRQEFLDEFGANTVEFVYVATPMWRHWKQLFSRDHGMWWIYYSLKNGYYFEKPNSIDGKVEESFISRMFKKLVYPKSRFPNPSYVKAQYLYNDEP